MAEKPQKSDTALREEGILKFWKERDIFNKSVAKDAPKGEYVFYDGPPFATGLPHYGHIVPNTIKDVIPRYKTMRGYRVPRVWGWDCHGLPIENIVEKELGFKHKKDIKEYGIAKFNERCRERVLTYAHEWEKIIPRMGRWADMEHAYRTMDKPFMESVWWVFKQIYDKGLVYEDYRSMHICPRCETTLSQQEVAEGYKDVKDISVTVKFELVDEPGTFILAWTTTPWTLPGNVALAVGSEIEYVKVPNMSGVAGQIHTHIEEGEVTKHSIVASGTYIMSKDFLWRNLHSNAGAMEVRDFFPDLDQLKGDVITFINDFDGFAKKYNLEVFKGLRLVGKSYKPPFDYYINNENIKNRENGWKVYAADFVTAEDGTGIAHEAPAFGADDWELLKKVNLPFVQHVNPDGSIKQEIKELAGKQAKPIEDSTATDVEVIKYLARRGLLFSKEKIEHAYPHCWRCDTPLLNYATSSWFVAVTKIKADLLQNAKNINWSPAHIKTGRFGDWLEGARDWSISRQRFWASVIPIWVCVGTVNSKQSTANSKAGCGHRVVFGSAAELEKDSGRAVDDLHKHVVDEITFPCEQCGGVMRRIPDVLDTWFDSGSMPYGERHYPFENKEKFDKVFPAQFIAEALDQTRAWFYYLHVLGGALFNKNAFQNVIVNGIVLAEDGKKMSKKLQNYPDPMKVVDKYGADALRLYLLSSPVMQAENLSFLEKGVDEVVKKNIGRLNNVLAFWKLYDDGTLRDWKSENILDRWILARLDQLILESTKGYEAYQLDTATRPIAGFVDDLSVWYLRRSRDRFKAADFSTSSASLRGPAESSAVSNGTSPDSAPPRLASEAEKSALEDKRHALATLRYVLHRLALVMAPATPFFAEYLFQAVRESEDEESVHLAMWPEARATANFIMRLLGQGSEDAQLIVAMEAARRIVSQALEAREKAGIRVRQPLASLSVPSGTKLSQEYLSIIADEVNVKKVELGTGIALDTDITEELREEGIVRDTMRAVQEARKAANMHPHEHGSIKLKITENRAIVEKYLDRIQKGSDTDIVLE